MKSNKVLLFYNPYAGNGWFKSNLDLLIERFQERGMLIVPIRADKKELLDDVFKTIRPNEYRKVIAAGGDGTVNIMVNAMINNNIDLPLALLPSGTANDFAYYFDLPDKMESMIDIALEENYTYADVGKAGGKYFVNVLAMGMIVDVSQKTDPNIKNTLGVLSYYLKGVSELPNLRPIPVKITCDEYNIMTNMYFMLVMNGRSAGGFKRISPKAEINDGLLDVMLFKEMPVMDLAPLLVNIMTGQHQENKNVMYFKTSKMHIESEHAMTTDVDGETGDPLPLDIEVIPKRLRIHTRRSDMEGAIW